MNLMDIFSPKLGVSDNHDQKSISKLIQLERIEKYWYKSYFRQIETDIFVLEN